MLRSKYGIHVICGACLLLFAMPQLPFEYSYDPESFFAYLWVSVTALFVVANWRRMLQLGFFARIQKERERRALWLEAQKHLPSRGRRRVSQRL